LAVQAATVAERTLDADRDSGGDTARDTGGDTAIDTGGDTAIDDAWLDDDACALTVVGDETTGEALLSLACGAVAEATLALVVSLAPDAHRCAADAASGALVCAVPARGVTGAWSPLCQWDARTSAYTCQVPIVYPGVGSASAPPTCGYYAGQHGLDPGLYGYSVAPTALSVGSTLCVPTPSCGAKACAPSWAYPTATPLSYAPLLYAPGAPTPPSPVPGYTPGDGTLQSLSGGGYALRPSGAPSYSALQQSAQSVLSLPSCTSDLKPGHLLCIPATPTPAPR
jgi:hypothetical protein